MPTHLAAWRETLALFGKTFPEKELLEKVGIPTVDFIKWLNGERGWDIDPDQFARIKEARFRELADSIEPIEPVVELVHRYFGMLPMAVVSGGVYENVHLALDAIGLREKFDTVITAEDPVKPKPSPDIFLEAARRLGVPPADCLVLEDAAPGIEGAKKAGMKFIDVRQYL